MKSKLQKLILAISTLICVQSAALAAPMTFESAVAEYKAGHYQSALSMFKAFSASSPSNAYVHYYIALCQHRLGHIDQARQEYQFVIQGRDAKLAPMAQAAMAQLSRAHTSGSSGSQTPAVANGTAQSSSPSQVSPGRRAKKVIEFYADW